MSDAIEVHGVSKRFDEVVALDGLDLTVSAGTVFGLLGPNGAGKTTLVRILATLLAPDSGRAAVLGYDVVREPLAVRRRIGLAGQFAAVDEELTGRENVAMIAQLYRLPRDEARRRTAEVLERFELVEAADRRVSTYSGGMRRRLDLAAGLIGRPPVVLLGDSLGGTHFWHGPQLTLWAERWCPLFTAGQARFVMTECEDQSLSFAMYVLARAGKVDPRRYLVLRTASNFCEPPPGEAVPLNLDAAEADGATLAEESAYRVGSRVVHALVLGWDRYEGAPPGS